MNAKQYFYACGQSARARGISKPIAEEFYCKGAYDFARIYFDKGFRGLSI